MSTGIERIVYVDHDGTLCRGRLLQRAFGLGFLSLTRLMYARGARLSIVRARYSEARLPGTWHYPSEPD
jgi:hypothetical protein